MISPRRFAMPAAGLALLAWTAVPASASVFAPASVPPGGGFYHLADGGRCLDVELRDRPCRGRTAQLRLEAAPGGQVILVDGANRRSAPTTLDHAGDGRYRVGGSLRTFEPLGGARRWTDIADGFAEGTTGGAAGATVTVTTQEELAAYVTAAEPYVIKVAATIELTPKGTELKVASDKTIIGAGTAGEIVGGGFFLGPDTSNVIIRNLTIRDTLMPEDDPDDKSFDYDAIQIDSAHHVWIDHNRLTRMNDGLLDSRKDATAITVSWNQFLDNNKTFGIGWTPNVTARMTIHHNWFARTGQRNPSADNLANLHMYSNYLQDVGAYGNYVRGGTKGVIEHSLFHNVPDPYYVSPIGELVQRDNIVSGSSFWHEGLIKEQGAAFEPTDFYAYAPDPATALPGLLATSAGPQESIGR
ncbi:polysaccharide lyase family 1 protein [Nonomuraea sp. NPDC050663]|uniref:polysaccharide lyase family 1 protein n=1 Tax=Nonomuraea sp. NPDC050663 TaxID=3364370 RepID=UPI003789C32D